MNHLQGNENYIICFFLSALVLFGQVNFLMMLLVFPTSDFLYIYENQNNGRGVRIARITPQLYTWIRLESPQLYTTKDLESSYLISARRFFHLSIIWLWDRGERGPSPIFSENLRMIVNSWVTSTITKLWRWFWKHWKD